MNTVAIVIACGREEEVAPGTEAAFLTLGDTPMLVHVLKRLEQVSGIDGIIIAISKSRVDMTIHLIRRYGFTKVKGVVVGGVNRLSTLRTVFSKLQESVPLILIQEASRPFTPVELLDEALKAGKRYGCAIAAHKLPDAIKLAPKGLKVVDTLERNSAWSAETPQVFKAEVFEKILKRKSAKIIDDESEFVQKPTEVHMVESGPLNMKIRTSDDLSVAMALLNGKIV